MTDVRTGVTPAVHAVLDRLDKGRVAWATFSDAGLRAEIAIEAGVLDVLDTADDAAMTSLSALRLAALLLFGIERASERTAAISAGAQSDGVL
jgi:hypothetical protein